MVPTPAGSTTERCCSAGLWASAPGRPWPLRASYADVSTFTLGGYIFPGYTALYTVILNVIVAVVLTPVFNVMNTRQIPIDETFSADYRA